MKTRVIAPAALALALLAGCGGDDTSGSAEAEVGTPSVTPTSAPAPSSPPAYAESDTCRAKMAPLVDIMLANETNDLDYPTFHDRFEELDRQMEKALLACSNDVSRPATRVVYEFSLANLAWGLCTGRDCATALIKKHLVKGTTLAYKVKAQVEGAT